VAKKRAYEMAGRALDLDPHSSQPYATLAVLQAVDKQYDQAIASARKAAGLGPGDAGAHITLGFVLSVAGRHAEAAAAIATAQRLDPNLSATDRQVAGLVLLLNGDLTNAVETLEKARAQAPGADDVHSLLAAAYATAGRMDEARAAAAEALRLGAISVESYRMELSYLRNGEDIEAVLAGLRKAGFHQWPSGFQGDERDRLSGGNISRLVYGHTLRGKLNADLPAILQVGKDGDFVFRSTALLYTGRAFVDGDRLCVQSESAGMGRPGCGPVYRRPAGEEWAFIYVHGSYAFYFSVAD
jgi:Flp pilus assembly protein TadD